jgi:hypothetical protein
MAQFKWLHEIDRPLLVKTWGPILQLRVPKKDGTKHVVLPADPVAGFQPDEVLSDGGTPIDFEDVRSLRCLRADPRVEEIT